MIDPHPNSADTPTEDRIGLLFSAVGAIEVLVEAPKTAGQQARIWINRATKALTVSYNGHDTILFILN